MKREGRVRGEIGTRDGDWIHRENWEGGREGLGLVLVACCGLGGAFDWD